MFVYNSPLGPLLVEERNGFLTRLDYQENVESDQIKEQQITPVLQQTILQLGEYFQGNRKIFDLPLLLDGTPFQKKAWEVLQTIPFGKTISYEEQAVQMGLKSWARAAGQANGMNPVAIIVPCHRVIGKDGSLTGYSSGVDKKKWLLDFESKLVSK
ncbi:MAG: methylated-DNA--[protein]-cysteine S-methyltransferase [SAR324 cluster bacterium]|nr:methylated-DNA--[protein]-cysteine S-methyltransferase [SAR324 cluster bacterium]